MFTKKLLGQTAIEGRGGSLYNLSFRWLDFELLLLVEFPTKEHRTCNIGHNNCHDVTMSFTLFT